MQQGKFGADMDEILQQVWRSSVMFWIASGTPEDDIHEVFVDLGPKSLILARSLGTGVSIPAIQPPVLHAAMQQCALED